MTDDVIKEKIKYILVDKLHANVNMPDNTLLRHSLLGPVIHLDYRSLFYLFFELEKEFGIQFSEEDICNGNFKSIQTIIEAIKSKQYHLMQEKIKEGV